MARADGRVQARVHHARHAGRRARGDGRARLAERARHGRLDGRGAGPGPRRLPPGPGAIGDQLHGRPGGRQPAAAARLHPFRQVPGVQEAQGGRQQGEPDRAARVRVPGHRLARLPVPRAVGARDSGDRARPQPVRPHVHAAPARGRPGAEDPAYFRYHRAHAGHLRPGRPADQAQGRPGHRGPHPGRPVRRVPGDGPQPARGTLAADHRRDLRRDRDRRLIPGLQRYPAPGR